MIASIQSIKGFGVFSGFQWPSNLPGFKQFNLIYGWNYSGKTTLSRAFQCYEHKRRHSDFPEAEIQLKSTDGTIHHLSTPETAPLFRVFNSDYVKDNLRFDNDDGAEPILMLGEEDITKQTALMAIKAERESLALATYAGEAKKGDTALAIDKALTRDARNLIKNQFGIPSYDKRDLELCVVACKAAPHEHLLEQQALERLSAIVLSTDKKALLSTKVAPPSSVRELLARTTAILARVVTAGKPMARLREAPSLEQWVNDGRALHEGVATCQFCEGALPPDYLTKLADHFSAEYDRLMTDLVSLISEVRAAQQEEVLLDHKSDYYPEFANRCASDKNRLRKLLEKRAASLQALIDILQRKRTSAFRGLVSPIVHDCAKDIESAITAINDTIAEHNRRTAEFDSERQQALRTIENHHAASFVLNELYNEKLKEIEELGKTIAGQRQRLVALDTAIRDLEESLSEATRGAEQINGLLAAYFGKSDLRIQLSPRKRFQIVRRTEIARNLSEGEKTAIAFAHFIARVRDGRHPLDDTRIVIDDPISSLDANHLFNTYALIKTQLGGCRQLFISTHSFELFNLVREWARDDEGDTFVKQAQSKWKRWGIYLVRRVSADLSLLEELPKELLRFKSEYHYLFSKLYHFGAPHSCGIDEQLGLPNVVRRFLEAFGGIMIPLYTGLQGKMARLFPDVIERERVWKFINHYSHNTTITRSLTIPDMSECGSVVQACLGAVRSWDDDYFKDMESEVA